MVCPPIKNPASDHSGRAKFNSFDDGNIQVFCPTGQVLFLISRNDSRRPTEGMVRQRRLFRPARRRLAGMDKVEVKTESSRRPFGPLTGEALLDLQITGRVGSGTNAITAATDAEHLYSATNPDALNLATN